ncbi:hypothetical protein E2C01_030636 [Portunus trituberculatus]|uniref:Uncharacterized protein n=1 Tax=Portunus trituberculatus TaxID=210409 RepID=A0A5B7ESI1_PORTR|nr:hypothetical protein [Portunus trituberculatus]
MDGIFSLTGKHGHCSLFPNEKYFCKIARGSPTCTGCHKAAPPPLDLSVYSKGCPCFYLWQPVLRLLLKIPPPSLSSATLGNPSKGIGVFTLTGIIAIKISFSGSTCHCYIVRSFQASDNNGTSKE